MIGRTAVFCLIYFFFNCVVGQSLNNVDSVFVGRQLLEAPSNNSSNGTIIDIKNCTLIYIRGMTLNVNKSKIVVPKLMASKQSTCGNDTAIVNLGLAQASSELSKFDFTLNFTKSKGSWQTTATLTFECSKNCSKDTDVPMDVQSWRAPLKISYHCSKSPVQTSNKYNGTNKPELIIDKIQIQVFEFTTPMKFDAAADCTPYFTIPTLSVLFVSFILLLILSYGIGMISNIKTMDRFDDPKGKPLQIASATE